MRRQNKYLKLRSRRAHQIAEFAAALVLLVLLFFIPLLDIGIMPVRFFMAQELINQYARRLSKCESLTQAYAEMDADPSLQTRLLRLGGVETKNLELHLLISTIKGDPIQKIDIVKPKTIPKEWFPDSKRGPYEYILVLVADIEVSPAMVLNVQPKVIGLSKPVPFELHADSPWENLGKNPVTKQFYLNE